MGITKDATKPRKIPWPANIYILLENSRMRNLEMSMVSVKKNPKQNFGLLEYFNPCGDFKKAFLICAHPHASSKTSMRQNNFKQIMTAWWDWKSSDKSAHCITLKKCIRQWITFPYAFRNELEYVHMQTHTHSCVYMCRVHQYTISLCCVLQAGSQQCCFQESHKSRQAIFPSAGLFPASKLERYWDR